MEFIFLHADKSQSFYKLVLLVFLMEVARDVQSTQNRKLVKFLQYLQKKKSFFNVVCRGEKSFTFIKSLAKNSFKVDTILLGGMRVKKFQELYHKAF